MQALVGIPTQAAFPSTDTGGCQLRTGLPQTPQGSHLDLTVGNFSANIRLLTITDQALGVRGGIQWTDTFTLVAGPGQIRDSSWDNCVGFAAEDYVTNNHAIIYATLYEKGDPIPIGSNAYGGILSASGSTATTQITGSISAWSQTTAPAGAVICDGNAYNSVSDPTFAPLYSIIGISFGGSGPSNFQVPDIRGRVIPGLNAASGIGTLGQTEGGTLAQRTPAHYHPINDPGHTHPYTDPGHAHAIPAYNAGSGGGLMDSWSGSTYIDDVGTRVAAIGITINNGATGITVGPTSLVANTPAFIVLPWIIWK